MTRLLLIASEPRHDKAPIRRYRLGRLLGEPRPLIDERPEQDASPRA